MQLLAFTGSYSALAQSVEHAAVNRSVVGSSPTSGAIPVIMAVRIHLFPFRTQKLSLLAPKVLSGPPLGRIGRCRISKNKRGTNVPLLFFYVLQLSSRAREDEQTILKTADTRYFCLRDECCALFAQSRWPKTALSLHRLRRSLQI